MANLPDLLPSSRNAEDWDQNLRNMAQEAQDQLDAKAAADHQHSEVDGTTIIARGETSGRPATGAPIAYLNTELETLELVDGEGDLLATAADQEYVQSAVEDGIASVPRRATLRNDHAQPCEEYYTEDGARSGLAFLATDKCFAHATERAGVVGKNLRLKLYGETLEFTGELINAASNSANALESGHYSSNVIANAFDDNSSTSWLSAANASGCINVSYIGYDFEVATRVRSFSLTNCATAAYVPPAIMASQYSYNGSTWYDIDTHTISTAAGITHGPYSVPEYPPARYFRLLAKSAPGGSPGYWGCVQAYFWAGIDEAEWNGSNPDMQITFGYAVVGSGEANLDRYFPPRRTPGVLVDAGALGMPEIPDGYLYEATATGYTGSTANLVFNSSIGAITTDGSIGWECIVQVMQVDTTIFTASTPGMLQIINNDFFQVDSADIGDEDDLIIAMLGRIPLSTTATSCMWGVMDAFWEVTE